LTGAEFLRRLARVGAIRATAVRYENHGKGSHGRVFFGTRFCTIKDRRHEIGPGLLRAMCRQLGVSVADLYGRTEPGKERGEQ
jgi:hypothetical protein